MSSYFGQELRQEGYRHIFGSLQRGVTFKGYSVLSARVSAYALRFSLFGHKYQSPGVESWPRLRVGNNTVKATRTQVKEFPWMKRDDLDAGFESPP